MKLSTKVRYGLRALIDLTLNYDNGLVDAQEIATRQQLSKKYLENLLASLKLAGLVKSERGSKGGYALSRNPQEITVEDVILALDGPITITDCLAEKSRCVLSSQCATLEVWQEMADAITSIARRTTLQSLADKTKNKKNAAAEVFRN